MSETRAVLFGLRTNVRYFASQRGFASLDVRLKALALLYDDLILEEGVYDCTAGEHGSFDWVTPYSDPEQLKPVRTRAGAPASMRMALTGSDHFRTVLAFRTTNRYRAQFVRTLQELAPLKPKWVHTVFFSAAPQIDDEAKRLATGWSFREREAVRRAMPAVPPFVRQRLHDNLNLDLARAAVGGTHLAPDPLNRPVLEVKVRAGDLDSPRTGERPLRLAMPELATATWEDVCRLRSWRGFAHLRAKMRELDDPELADRGVQARLLAEYQAEVERSRPRWATAAWAGASFVIGIIPIVGQIAGPLLDAADAVRASVAAARGARHWTATLVKARKHLSRGPRLLPAPVGTEPQSGDARDRTSDGETV